jgi:hypothetical protein
LIKNESDGFLENPSLSLKCEIAHWVGLGKAAPTSFEELKKARLTGGPSEREMQPFIPNGDASSASASEKPSP